MGLLGTFNCTNNFCIVVYFVMGWPWLNKWKIKANWTIFSSYQFELHHEWLVTTWFQDLLQNITSHWQPECCISRNNVPNLSDPWHTLKPCDDLHVSIENQTKEQKLYIYFHLGAHLASNLSDFAIRTWDELYLRKFQYPCILEMLIDQVIDFFVFFLYFYFLYCHNKV